MMTKTRIKHGIKAGRTALLAVIVMAVAGCATIASLQPGAGSTMEIRDRSYDAIWQAAVRTTSRSLTIVEHDKARGTLKAEKGAGMTTYGEVVGIFIRPSSMGADTYTVEVQSLKRHRLQLTGQDWTATMLAGIRAELDL